MNMSQNEDFTYAMKPYKFLSWPIGTWPLQTYNLFSFVRYILAIIILASMVLILDVELYLDRSNADANLDALMLIICGSLAVAKVTCYRVCSTRLTINFLSAQKDYDRANDEEKRTIMRRHAYMGKLACVSVVLMSHICATIITIAPMLLKDDAKVNATTDDATIYPVPSYHVLALLKLPESLRSVIYITEFLMLVTACAGNVGSDSLFFGIAFHLCGQAELLKMELNELFDESAKTARNFHTLVRRHDYLMKLIGMLNNTIGTILLAQLFASSILICTCGFQFILSLHDNNVVISVKAFVVLITVLLQVFVFSYVGDYLKWQMDGVGYSVYSSGWYRLPANVARDVVIVILKAQEPVHLSAGKFFVVNMETYMGILKTSMSYLSVLRVVINA